MEAFQQSLDALQRESNELIAACQETLVAAVSRDNAPPARLAMALAQRFTESRIDHSFPVICLLDFMLSALVKAPPDASNPASVAQAAVLGELWALVLPLFTAYATHADSALREKVLRRVRRWKQRNLLTEPTVGRLLDAVENGPAQAAPSTAHAEGEARGADDAQPSPQNRPAQPQPQQSTFTHAQARAFAAVLRRCTAALEQLPPARARPYVDLIAKEHFTRPSAAALLFYQDLLGELQQRERSASATAPPTRGEAAGAGADGSTSAHRAALGQLLDRLATSAGEDGRDGTGAASASAVMRYTSPLFSDVNLRQTLPQRSGFAVLNKRRVPLTAGAASGDMYYPKKEDNTARPFRVPAALHEGGRAAVRVWFPTPQEWLAERDMAAIPLFMSRADAHLAGGGAGGRKRVRE